MPRTELQEYARCKAAGLQQFADLNLLVVSDPTPGALPVPIAPEPVFPAPVDAWGDPYSPYGYDRGVKVVVRKWAAGKDPSQPDKGLHIEALVYVLGVSDWKGIVEDGEGGFTAFQFEVEESVELGEMTINTDLSIAKDFLTIQDDDVPTKEVVGAYGSRNQVVLDSGILVRLDWHNIDESIYGPVKITLKNFALSDSDNGLVINGVNFRVPHTPEEPSFMVVL